MSGWVEVSFRAKLADGMVVSDLDVARASSEVARLFGFVQVDAFTLTNVFDQVSGDGGAVLGGPRQAFGGPDNAMHASRDLGGGRSATPIMPIRRPGQ